MDEDVNMTSQLEEHSMLLNHVLLPRVLPQQKERFYNEQAIVIQFIENIENVSEWLPVKTVEMMERLKCVTLECKRAVVSNIINELEPGGSFSMFIRRQNCTLMFYRPSNQLQNIIIATFVGNLHPKETYKHESDIEVRSFPYHVFDFRNCSQRNPYESIRTALLPNAESDRSENFTPVSYS